MNILAGVQQKNRKPHFEEIWIWWWSLWETCLLVSAIQGLFLIKYFLTQTVRAMERHFITPFSVCNVFLVPFRGHIHYYLVEWQSLSFCRSKRIRRGNADMHILSHDSSSLGRTEQSLWIFWKDSISWDYPKPLLTNWTVFKISFQTPSAGILEE